MKRDYLLQTGSDERFAMVRAQDGLTPPVLSVTVRLCDPQQLSREASDHCRCGLGLIFHSVTSDAPPRRLSLSLCRPEYRLNPPYRSHRWLPGRWERSERSWKDQGK